MTNEIDYSPWLPRFERLLRWWQGEKLVQASGLKIHVITKSSLGILDSNKTLQHPESPFVLLIFPKKYALNDTLEVISIYWEKEKEETHKNRVWETEKPEAVALKVGRWEVKWRGSPDTSRDRELIARNFWASAGRHQLPPRPVQRQTQLLLHWQSLEILRIRGRHFSACVV